LKNTQGTQISWHMTRIIFTRAIRQATKSHHPPGRKLKLHS